MSKALLGCLLGVVVVPVASAQVLGFEVASKDEKNFTKSCLEDQVSCSYSRTMLLADGRLRQLTLTLLDAENKDLVASYGGLGQAVWRQVFDCRTDSVQEESVLGLARDGAPLGLETGFESKALNERVCSSSVSSTVLSEVLAAGGRYVSIRRVTTVDKAGGVMTGTIEIPPASRSRLLIGSAGDATLFADSAVMSGRIVRGALKGSTVILDQDPGSGPGGQWVLFSNKESWAQVAVRYGNAEAALLRASGKEGLPGDGDGQAPGLVDRVAATAADVAGRLRYKLSWSEADGLPSRSPSEVFARGEGDCRDMAIALISELNARGIPAVSVLTSTKGGAPRSLVVPDMGWANHVVVHVPGAGLFLDITAGDGSWLVTPSSAIWGAVGFRTDTGEIIVIK